MIHITDSLTDRILDDISEELFWNDKHRKSLKNTLETFDFTTFADKPFSEHLAKRNRIIIPDEDGQFVEFIIENTRKFHGVNGFSVEVYTSASYIELIKAKVISPQTTPSWTPRQHVDFALAGTGWEAGEIYFAGVRSLTIEKHTNPFAYLKRLAAELDLELHFRVEKDGNKIVRRYVDLVERVGAWRGREAEFGKDLIGIERKENNANIVTALVGLGPIREDGTRLEVFVEDKDALTRWGRNGQHLVEVYEPQSTDQDMTIERLTELTENELKKRVNSVVEYLADIADLEKVPGLEHEKIRFGDTLKIKDTMFNPPLYLEARVHTQERSVKKDGTKKVELGDYIEYKEEDVLAIWKSLQAEIARKVSLSDVTEVVYTKIEVDDKDASVFQDGTIYTDSVSETKKQEAIQVAATDATNKANQAENNAKSHAENVASQAEQNANGYTEQYAEKKVSRSLTPPTDPEIYDLWIDENDGYIKQWTGTVWKPLAPTTPGEIGAVDQTEYDQMVQDLESDIATKADATWVNGQLVLKADASEVYTKSEVDTSLNTKADKATTYTKTEVDDALNSKVSVTTYTTDMNGIVTELDDHESRITQTENEIATKVSQTQYDADVGDLQTRMNQAESSITQNANEIALKVSQTEFNNYKSTNDSNVSDLQSRMSSAETSIIQNANSISLKADQSTVDNIDSRLSTAEATLTVHANEIATKVSQTEFNEGKPIEWITGNATNAYNVPAGENNGVWYRIAYNSGSRAFARFIIRDTTSSQHGTAVFTAGVNYNRQDNIDFTLLSFTTYSHFPVTKARILTKSTYDTQYLEIFVSASRTDIPTYLQYWILENIQSTGWVAVNFQKITSIPTGYNVTEFEINKNKAVSNRLTTAESSITQLSNEITLKVNQQDYDIDMNDLTSRMSSAESSITLLSDEIDLKVNKDGIIAAFNISPESIKLQASKIALDGYVEAKHIKSLNGLNINNQFVVDSSGNVRFLGTLEAASSLGDHGTTTILNGLFENRFNYEKVRLTTGRLEVSIFDESDANHSKVSVLNNLISHWTGDSNYNRLLITSRNGFEFTSTRGYGVKMDSLEITNELKVENWKSPTLLNGWSGNYGGLYYRKLPHGVVEFKGCIAGGTQGVTAFTLPAGYRPVNDVFAVGYTVLNGGYAAVARIWIAPNGNVRIDGAQSNVFFYNVSFPTN